MFGGLTPICVETLKAVPMLLETTDERVRRRLLPDAYTDPEEQEQWRRHGTPELERLFLSRSQLIRRDLAQLRRLRNTDTWVLTIGDGHVNAWLSSLNAARLALYELNDLTPMHMERGGFEAATQKQREALFRIQFMADLQSFLLGDVDVVDASSLPDSDSEDDDPERDGCS